MNEFETRYTPVMVKGQAHAGERIFCSSTPYNYDQLFAVFQFWLDSHVKPTTAFFDQNGTLNEGDRKFCLRIIMDIEVSILSCHPAHVRRRRRPPRSKRPATSYWSYGPSAVR